MCRASLGGQLLPSFSEMQNDLASDYLRDRDACVMPVQIEATAAPALCRSICSDSQMFESRTTVSGMRSLGCVQGDGPVQRRSPRMKLSKWLCFT